jgi:outer membrane murein-binding lipoprotein Lpp
MAQLLAAIVLSSLLLFGCSSNLGSAGLGAAGGAAAGAAGYEYNAHRQLQQLEEDYKAGRIDRKEYEARKEQIQKGSILK